MMLASVRAQDITPGTMLDRLREKFAAIYGGSPLVFRAPGRVNIIGEHTDYNDGFVMPAALDFYTYVAIAPRNDATLRVHSENFDESREFQLDALQGGPTGHWSDYVRGVAGILREAGHNISGANLLIHGNVPIGSGLSSSASLEVACALALLEVSGIHLDRLDVARVAQRAEHAYAGTLCGIMDQFISCFGKANNALMLDCRSLHYELLPLPSQLKIVVCNTKVKHDLAAGEYNKRRSECETGVQILRKHIPGLQSLRDVTVLDLDRYREELPAQIYRRCHHVVTENARVIAAATAIRSGDLEGLGVLLDESHASLRTDYEVSCRELDVMVEIAQSLAGIHGARMTGGGFGGCTVNLVEADLASGFAVTIKEQYSARTSIVPEVYVCAPADAAGYVKS